MRVPSSNRRRSGATSVEFAFVAILLFMLLFGIFEYGRFLFVYHMTTNAARDAARFAVVRTGGKQYKVAKDSVLKVESLAGDVGSKLTLGDVLMLGGDTPKIGAPLVKGASIQCEILEHGQGEKVIAFKKKRRKNTHRKRGHRQHFTKVKVLGITAG